MTSYTIGWLTEEFPDYDVVGFFDPAFPVYRLVVTARVLETQSLSTISTYILRIIAAQTASIERIAYLLGLEKQDVVSATADLLRTGLVERIPGEAGTTPSLNLTIRGRAYLDQREHLFAPRKRRLNFHFDPLVKKIEPRYRDDLVARSRILKDGRAVVQVPAKAPRLSDLDTVDLESVLQDNTDSPRQSIVALVSMRTPYVEYLGNRRVFLLQNRWNSTEQRLAIYHGRTYLRGPSNALQHLFSVGEFLPPEDLTLVSVGEQDLLEHVPINLQSDARKVLEERQRFTKLERELAERKAQEQQVETREEVNRLYQEIAELNEKLKSAQLAAKKADELSDQINFISTENHRSVLEKALRTAQKRIVIISPWMNTRAVDRQLRVLIRGAIERGVTILIGYGFGFDERGEEGERNRRSADIVIREVLGELEGLDDQRIVFKDVGRTHEKLLICDNAFAVVTSLNWLSYKGEIDAGYRHETGVVFKIPEKISELSRRALAHFGSHPAAVT